MMGCTIPPTDTNDGVLFLLPLTPMMGNIPPTDTNDGVLFLPLTPMMGCLFLPLVSMMGRYSSH
ncbi:unnamed protein product [Staurois parvus]|uniref:Uncharacterized protein n=1 Tax=Staurois parvus TaxID=386267 RepID=A0ABN9HGF2_9NEOB|nr:unnamed protein product [Staurois parvus]